MYILPLAAVKSGRSEIVASDERNDDKVECSSALSIDNGSTVAIVELEVVDAFSNAVGRISKNYVYIYSSCYKMLCIGYFLLPLTWYNIE